MERDLVGVEEFELAPVLGRAFGFQPGIEGQVCLLYTSDAADE